jgi:hypothetical protein
MTIKFSRLNACLNETTSGGGGGGEEDANKTSAESNACLIERQNMLANIYSSFLDLTLNRPSEVVFI